MQHQFLALCMLTWTCFHVSAHDMDMEVEANAQIQFSSPPTANIPCIMTLTLLYPNHTAIHVKDLLPTHTRLLHFLLISPHGSTFFHLHPEDTSTYNDTNFIFNITFPWNGEWIGTIDYNYAGTSTGHPVTYVASYTLLFHVAGDTNEPIYDVNESSHNMTQTLSFPTYLLGLNESFTSPISPRSSPSPYHISFSIYNPEQSHADNDGDDINIPITIDMCSELVWRVKHMTDDVMLTPYLGAAAHIILISRSGDTPMIEHLHAVIPNDTAAAHHTHPKNMCENDHHSTNDNITSSFPPVVSSTLRFPRSGHWLVIAQFSLPSHHMIAAMYDIIIPDIDQHIPNKQIHGILMILSWMILTPISILIARYMRDSIYWITFHRLISLISLIIACIAYSLAHWGFGTHTRKGHMILGSLIMILALTQPLIICCVRDNIQHRGSITMMNVQKMNEGQSYWSFWHHHMGYIIMILAWFNCYLGVSIYSSNPTYMIIITFILIIMSFITFACSRRKPHHIIRQRTYSQPTITLDDRTREICRDIHERTRLKEEDGNVHDRADMDEI